MEFFLLNEKFDIRKYKNILEAFGIYVFSQILRVQEHKFYCKLLISEPIYDYELPWSFLNFDVGGQDIDPAILNALQSEEFNWIGNIPLEALKILREENQMAYMRSVLRNGITSMQTKQDIDLTNTINQLQENLNEAFNRQKTEVEDLKNTEKNIKS